MNKSMIAALSCLVCGGFLGWGAARLAGGEHDGHATEQEHAKLRGTSSDHEGPDEHDHESREAGEHREEAHGESVGPDEAGEPPEGHGGHGGEHGAEGLEPGVIPDSMLAVAGIAIDTVGPSTLAEVLALPGRIRNDPARRFVATTRFPGVLRTFGLKAGSKVKAGDLVARVESDATLEPYEIRAPRSGTVLRTEVTEGQAVAAGQVLAEIADLGTVLAELKAGSREFARLRVGQAVTVTTHGDDAGRRSRLATLLPQVDPATQMRTVQLKLDNSRGMYGEGLFVQGLVETGRFEAPLTVPLACLQTSKGKTVVYVREGGRFEERVVATGRKDGARVEVLSGLRGGERVATSGSFVVKADLGKAEAEHAH